jgi:4-alpha-glucanotransferase
MASDAPSRHILERAAAQCRIEPEYEDTWGRRHAASDRTLHETLEVLGVPASNDEALQTALEWRELSSWSRPIEPCLVVFETQPGPDPSDEANSIRVHVREERAAETIRLEIQWENGDPEHHQFSLPELRELERTTIEGATYLAKALQVPSGLRLGYHQIRLYFVNEPDLELFGEARLIVCPRRARGVEGRIAGIALSLYGLRSSRNWGCGDFTDLRAAVEAFASAGAAFIALNPLHAIANRQPFNTSPYLPQCSLYRNFIYLDVERVPGFDPSDVAQEELATLRGAEFVEYERVASVKLAALRRAFERCRVVGDVDGFEEYVRGEGDLLHNYAVYCVLDEQIRRNCPGVWVWPDWPVEFHDPRSPQVEEFAAQHSDDVLFYKFMQWQVDRQLAEVQEHALAAGMKIGLYHDLALATDRFGADLWALRTFYAQGARVGAPPDALAPGGQDWGFPPPDREAHRENGYELFAQSIRRNARHGGALRIDHVMRFFRLFWIPDHLTAADGVYVQDYVNDLLGVLALESVRGNFIVIGEDLGTVSGEVRRRLEETGILGYRVLWFERDFDGRFRGPGEYPWHAAVSTTTHDLPTAAGFFEGRDIEARKEAGLIGDAEYGQQWDSRRYEITRLREALDAAGASGDPLGFVLSTPCSLAIVNQEDLTGEAGQQNLPASTWQHPNWRRKMRVAVEDLGPIAAELRSRLERAGRI